MEYVAIVAMIAAVAVIGRVLLHRQEKRRADLYREWDEISYRPVKYEIDEPLEDPAERLAAIAQDTCPECFGDLHADTWICEDCGFDPQPEVTGYPAVRR